MNSKICFITTCKGRLSALKQSLPTMVSQPDSEVVVVDYSCPENTGAWVKEHFPQCRVVAVPHQAEFHLSRARNLGFEEALKTDADWICFNDADVGLAPHFSQVARELFKQYQFLIYPSQSHMAGLLVLSKKDFAASQRYDENIRGYGREASDMRLALFFQGLRFTFLPKEVAWSMEHADEDRTRFYKDKDLQRSNRRNSNLLWRKIKRWEAQTGLKPPEEGFYFIDEPSTPLMKMWNFFRPFLPSKWIQWIKKKIKPALDKRGIT